MSLRVVLTSTSAEQPAPSGRKRAAFTLVKLPAVSGVKRAAFTLVEPPAVSGAKRAAFTLVELPVVSGAKRAASRPVELPAVSGVKRAAFTLVELLVVIGIISVLIGILLPTLAGARRSARNVRCAANLRSLGAAAVLYANEHKGFAPTYLALYGSVRVPWYDQLNRYVFNRPAIGTPPSVINQVDFERSIFVGCPNFPFERFPGAALNTSIGYSMSALPLAPLSLEENRFTQGSTTGGRYFKLTEFKNPANRALMGEMNGWGGLLGDGADPTYNYRAAPRNNAKGDIDYFRHSRPLDMTRAGSNVLFADGHVELLTPWAAWYAVRDPARRAAGSDRGY